MTRLLHARRLLVAAIFATGAATVLAAAAPTTPSRLTPAETRQATALALPLLEAGVDDAPGVASHVKTLAPPTWSDAGPAHRALLLATLASPHARDASCQLFTLPADLASAQAIDATFMPDCLGITRAWFVDINGDGRLDLVVRMRVQSNRYDAVLEIAEAFVSDVREPSGWCWSSEASGLLQYDDLASVARLQATLARERARLALAPFDCSRALAGQP